MLSEPLPDGATLAQGIREDGSEHYREHTADLRVDGREPMTRIQDLLAELAAEHDAFVAALEAVDLELVTAPGVVEDWSVRDLVVHVAFWAEHASDALRLATEDRGDEFAYDTAQTDAMNARLLEESRVTRRTPRSSARSAPTRTSSRAITALDPALLDAAARQRRHRGGRDRLRRSRALPRAHRPPARLVLGGPDEEEST